MKLGVTAVMLSDLDFDEQVDLCARLGLSYYQYRPRVIGEAQRDKPFGNWGNHKFDLTPRRLVDQGRELTRRLRDAGLEPWGTVPGLSVDADDDALRVALDGAVAADTKCVRCNPPRYPDEPFDYPSFIEHVVHRYQYVIERLSWPVGIKLIIETHANSIATSPGLAWQIVRHFPANRLGVIYDLPNYGREGMVQPHLAASVLAPHIDCVHVGGSRRVEKPNRDQRGCRVVGNEFCRLEDSDLHVPTWIAALQNAGVDAPLIIESFEEDGQTPPTERLSRAATFLKSLPGVE